MPLWKRSEAPTRQIGTSLPELTERLEALERRVKALRLEWDDAFERLERVMGRLAKQRGRLEASQTDDREPARAETLIERLRREHGLQNAATGTPR